MLSGILNSWFLMRSIEEFALRSAAGGCAFPVAAKMTFRAPVQTAAVPPMTFVLGHGLLLIGFVTLPNSAAHENSPLRVTCTTLAGQTNHAQQMHHSAVANVGNLRWHLF
jgi:hypothetical protein